MRSRLLRETKSQSLRFCNMGGALRARKIGAQLLPGPGYIYIYLHTSMYQYCTVFTCISNFRGYTLGSWMMACLVDNYRNE